VGKYRSVVDEKNEIIYTQWQDRKLVTMGSNCYSCEPLSDVMTGRGSNKKTVSKPTNVCHYNNNMGGVDIMDFYVNIYRPKIRSKKWYWPLFSWTLSDSCPPTFLRTESSPCHSKEQKTWSIILYERGEP
jgi:hypothetical protein